MVVANQRKCLLIGYHPTLVKQRLSTSWCLKGMWIYEEQADKENICLFQESLVALLKPNISHRKPIFITALSSSWILRHLSHMISSILSLRILSCRHCMCWRMIHKIQAQGITLYFWDLSFVAPSHLLHLSTVNNTLMITL